MARKHMSMDYRIPFPDEQQPVEEDRLEKYSGILMKRLSLKIADDDAADTVAYQFPKEIKSEAGKMILAIDFLMDWSGKSISDLLHLGEDEIRTMVSLKWVMGLVPHKEMDILGKELQSPMIKKAYKEVKMKIFEEGMLMRWKDRLENDERLRMDGERIVVDSRMLND